MTKPILAISPGNKKLGRIPNISTIPVKDCGNCSACMHDCYALKAWRMYPNVRDAWKKNSKAFHFDSFHAFNYVHEYLVKKKPAFFRIHQAGDFLDQNNLNAWCNIARGHPGTKFLAFTKMHDLDFGDVPDNLAIVLSVFPAMDLPLQGMPIAFLQDGTEARIPQNTFVCPGQCKDCKHCWDKKSVVFNKH